MRVEELSPFPFDQLAAATVMAFPNAELVWVQEEPQNMGFWGYVDQRIRTMVRVLDPERVVEVAGRAYRRARLHPEYSELVRRSVNSDGGSEVDSDSAGPWTGHDTAPAGDRAPSPATDSGAAVHGGGRGVYGSGAGEGSVPVDVKPDYAQIVRYVGRPVAAAATGSFHVHQAEMRDHVLGPAFE